MPYKWDLPLIFRQKQPISCPVTYRGSQPAILSAGTRAEQQSFGRRRRETKTLIGSERVDLWDL